MSVHALIKHSIVKWENILEIPKRDFRRFSEVFAANETCSLCNAFKDSKHTQNSCINCPILIKTGASGCRRTPIEEIEPAMDENKFKRFQQYVQLEIRFLNVVLHETPDVPFENFEQVLDKTNKAIGTMYTELENLNTDYEDEDDDD